MTLSWVWKPSISVRSWFSVFSASISALPPDREDFRALAKESSSSIKMMERYVGKDRLLLGSHHIARQSIPDMTRAEWRAYAPLSDVLDGRAS